MSIALASNATSDDMAASDTMVSNYGGTATWRDNYDNYYDNYYNASFAVMVDVTL
jgi:hypothetical protein